MIFKRYFGRSAAGGRMLFAPDITGYNPSMCGRYTLRVSPAELAEIFDAVRTIEWVPRFNIAPTQTVVAVRPAADADGRELALLRWGLIPSWARDAKTGSSLINARAD